MAPLYSSFSFSYVHSFYLFFSSTSPSKTHLLPVTLIYVYCMTSHPYLHHWYIVYPSSLIVLPLFTSSISPSILTIIFSFLIPPTHYQTPFHSDYFTLGQMTAPCGPFLLPEHHQRCSVHKAAVSSGLKELVQLELSTINNIKSQHEMTLHSFLIYCILLMKMVLS